MTIRWIGQSGYVLTSGTTELLIDPYLSDVVNRVANRPRMVAAPFEPEEVRSDAVICTHDHLDHLDPDAVVRMDKSLKIITTAEGRAKLKTLGHDNVRVLTEGESTIVGNFTLTAVYAHHTVEAFGIIVRAEGKTLYFSGDTLFDEKLYEVAYYHPDAVFLCINGKLGNMNVEEALTVARAIGAPLNIPNHYGMFASNTEDPAKFTTKITGGFAMEYNRTYEFEDMK